MVEFKNIHLFYFYEPYLNNFQIVVPDIVCYNHDLIICTDIKNNFKKDYVLKYIIKKDSLW